MPRRLVPLIFAIALAASPGLSAQNLPKLAKASEITNGKLPDGISYYISSCTNPAGFADFALIKKGEYSVEECRRELCSLPHFGKRKPYEFLADYGVGYGRDGFISYQPDAVVFRFNNMPTASQSVTDSLLMMLFDMSAASGRESAIVVSGDVNSAKMVERMQMLSMIAPKPSVEAGNVPGYAWSPARHIDFKYIESREREPAVLEWTFRSPRTPQNLLGTVQPQVSKMYSRILGTIIKERLEFVFPAYDAPLASVVTSFQGSDSGWDDEKFTLRIVTDPSGVAMATSMVATVLAELDEKGADLQEFRMARSQVTAAYARAAVTKEMSNSDFADKCIASYLYGSDLAGFATVAALFTGKKFDEEKELGIFNRFAGAMLKPEEGVDFVCSTPSCPVARETLPELFKSSWATANRLGIPEPADTSRMIEPGKKVKIKATASEPVTGGQLWTMSNGIKVIYKNCKYGGEFRYALLVRGGFPGISGLSSGESAFASDMLGLYRVAGMSHNQFHDMLRNRGISMRCNVGLTDIRVSGIAPASGLQTVMKSLIALAEQRECDPEAFRYYRRCESLRIRSRDFSQEGVYGWMDSKISPDYFYTPVKNIDNLRDDFQKRADDYFGRQFSGMENALLVIVGDVPEAELKKQVCKYLGGFSTGSPKIVRAKSAPGMENGWWTVSALARSAEVGPAEGGVSTALSARMTFSAENYMAMRLAETALRKRLALDLSACGMTASVNFRMESYPLDRITLFVNCRPCTADGLPAGVSGSRMDALNAVRKAVHRLAAEGVSDAELKADKAALTSEIGAQIARPDQIVDAVLMRNSSGKDLVTGYKDKVGAVSKSAVKDIFKALDNGTRVEYIVN